MLFVPFDAIACFNMQAHHLSDQQVKEFLDSLPDGKKVHIKYHVRDEGNLRAVRGTIFKHPNEHVWVVRRSSTSYQKFPSPDAHITSIDALDDETRSASEARTEFLPFNERIVREAVPLGQEIAESDAPVQQPRTQPTHR
jgi:hypothetical protein